MTVYWVVTEREREGERQRHRETETDRGRQRQRQRETERQRQRERERGRETETETETQGERNPLYQRAISFPHWSLAAFRRTGHKTTISGRRLSNLWGLSSSQNR